MNVIFEKVENTQYKYKICKDILEALPEWFGIPESNLEYCEGVKNKVFYSVKLDIEIIGFIALKHNSKYVLEIYVMGIKKDYHSKGIGKKLINEVINYAKREKYEYLEVKTLDESRESLEYRKTRKFYESVGFIPLDVLMNEWGEDNPCLIMIKRLNE